MSKISRWWYSIDSVMLVLVFGMILVGAMLVATASPAVAERIGLHSFYFLYRQLAFLLIGFCIIILLSMLNYKAIKGLSFIGFCLSVVLMVLALFIGEEVKGAKRWISIFGFSLQPSELLKPFYAVVVAQLLSSSKNLGMKFFRVKSSHLGACIMLHIVITSLLLLQPDFGIAATVFLVTVAQFFVAGLPIFWVLFMAIVFMALIFAVYQSLPHVAMRIDNFLSSDIHANYQVEKSIESYVRGGFFGNGPGEGSVKLNLPDSHTDFIFAVAGEEMGTLFCLFIVALFVSILVRGVSVISESKDLFRVYAVVGILMYFGMQSIFNIGVTLHLFPTKGMTLPFISYGGSSIISFAIAIGIYLSLSRNHTSPIAYAYNEGLR